MGHRRTMRAAGAALVCAGCGADAPEAAVRAARDLGPLAFEPVIRGRDGGYSARWGDRSVWVFGDTTLQAPGEDGSTWRSSTFCATDDLDASDGLSRLAEPLDAAGAPGELLPFTEEERAFNLAHFGPQAEGTCTEDCGARYALWPGPVVVDVSTGRALVFYTKLMARPGAFNFEVLGSSIAVWERLDAPPARPELRPGAADPTLLFDADEPAPTTAALVHEGVLYAYGCACAGFTCPCLVARAPVAEATERGAWRFFSGGGWVEGHDQAEPVTAGAPMMSVHWNERAGRYIALYSEPVSSHIALRTAPAPEGPWSDSEVVFTAMAPSTPEAWPYAGLGHGELARDGGRLEYVTYFRETGFLQGELRLVELELE
ncbi:DUF4185 domain-containing protein [Sorangium sp. So ce1024]|uniref:DUF4185 domain-containing protein n=1 Tax=Sorangium sp. So ce1024 TaxID=3133327 RepID=UPI003F03E3C1